MQVCRKLIPRTHLVTKSTMNFSTTSSQTFSTNDVKLRETGNSGVFFIPLSEKAEATLDYVVFDKKHIDSEKNIMSINHVIVPSEFGGKGLAQIVCEKAFDFAKTNDYLIYPQCTYVKNRYVPGLKSPELKKLVTDVNPNVKSAI